MDSGLDRNETRNARMRCTVFAIHNRQLFLLLLAFLAGVRVVDLPSNKHIVVFADLLLSTAGHPPRYSRVIGVNCVLECNGAGSLHPRTVIQ